jgi:RNA polymerase sigma factor (sigma-70 family)
VDELDWLAQRFEEHRARLAAVAYRMLGSRIEADDAVQEAWLRLSRADPGAVHNLGGWLTTVVGRVCLDMLRSRAAHREEPLDEQQPEPAASRVEEVDPEQEALMAESVGLALLVVLDTLAPAERLAFVLHDMFAVPFDEIARYWAAPRTPPSSSPAAPGSGYKPPRRRPTTTSPARPTWSRPFSPPPAAVTSPHCSQCSTPTSYSTPTPRPSGPVPWQASAARLPLPHSSPAAPKARNPRSSTDCPALCGPPPTERPAARSASQSPTGRSCELTSSWIHSSCASSILSSSTAESLPRSPNPGDERART